MKAVQVVKPGELHVIDMEKPRIDPVKTRTLPPSVNAIAVVKPADRSEIPSISFRIPAFPSVFRTYAA